MTRVDAIRQFFGQGPGARPVTSSELLELRQLGGMKAYTELGDLCLAALGHSKKEGPDGQQRPTAV